MRITRLSIAKKDILDHFDGLSEKIFMLKDLERALIDRREAWRLTRSMRTAELIDFLRQKGKLREIRLELRGKTIVRYTWGDVPIYPIALSLDKKAYLSHYTAVYCHELTEQIPKAIYVNIEQKARPKPKEGLEQERIRKAFERSMRETNSIAPWGDWRICVLNGKQTGNLGVIEMDREETGKIRVTDIERTLIDIAVRPNYAGGVFEVLKAYQLGKGRASVNKLVAMLKKLDFIYPYHQAIGFYLQRAGYKESSLRLLKKCDMDYDFYLTHKMGKTEYTEEWRLLFPKGM